MTADFRKSITIRLAHCAAFPCKALPPCQRHYGGKPGFLSWATVEPLCKETCVTKSHSMQLWQLKYIQEQTPSLCCYSGEMLQRRAWRSQGEAPRGHNHPGRAQDCHLHHQLTWWNCHLHKKKKSIWVSAIKNRHLLSMYVNCFKRGKDVQAWWLIFAFISKSIQLILKVQKSFLHIWFIMCSVSRV